MYIIIYDIIKYIVAKRSLKNFAIVTFTKLQKSLWVDQATFFNCHFVSTTFI